MDKSFFSAVLNGGTDVDVSEISACSLHSLDDCEKNCPHYYGCDTVSMANDILAEYEKQYDVVPYDTMPTDALFAEYASLEQQGERVLMGNVRREIERRFNEALATLECGYADSAASCLMGKNNSTYLLYLTDGKLVCACQNKKFILSKMRLLLRKGSVNYLPYPDMTRYEQEIHFLRDARKLPLPDIIKKCQGCRLDVWQNGHRLEGSHEEAGKLADSVFSQMTECMTAQRLIDKILSKEDFEKEYEGRKVPVRADSQSAGN